ncbi:MAG: hypothetical protein ACKVS7_06930 [Gemmatimonadaceae bacterium]
MRPSRTAALALIGFVLIAACSTTAETPLAPGPVGGGPQPGPGAPLPPALRVWIDAVPPFVGMTRRVNVSAAGPNGLPLNASTSVLSFGAATNADVELIQTNLFDAIDPITGLRTARRPPLLHFRSTGSVTLHASLGALRDSFSVAVQERPPLSAALGVESFEIVEYRVSCGSGCAHFYYVPTLEVREPTGGRLVSIVGLEFGMPSWTTGLCGGNQLVPPNSRAIVAGTLYGDDVYGLLDSRTTADSVPPGPASVELVVGWGGGNFGTIRATGSIRRVEVPSFNAATLGRDTWDC